MIDPTKSEAKSRTFILKNANSDDYDGLLKLFNLMCQLYGIWGMSREPDIEMSVKIGKEKISYNRYAIPVVGAPAVTLNMIKKVLEGVDAPSQLLDVIKERHSKRIRMIVGYDYDSGGKRIYFHEGGQAYGYEFKDDSNFYVKNYTLVPKTDYPLVTKHFAQMGLQDEFIKTFLQILPFESWSQVCERKNPLVNKENMIGYHLSSSRKVTINEIGRNISKLMGLINTGLDKREFDLWLQKNEDSYLSWIGIAANKNSEAEVTLYIRPDAENWDERYQPNDFISFFGMEIMNM